MDLAIQFRSLRLTLIQLLDLTAADTNTDSQYGTIPQGVQSASYLVAGWLHWTSSIMERAAFCSDWNRHLPWLHIFLPCPQSCWVAKTTICGLTQYLIHQHGTLHSVASDQETHVTAKEVQQWAHARGIHWFDQDSTPWSHWFDRTVEWPLENSVTAPARWQ